MYVVIRKSARGHFLFMVIMETLKYTCVQSFTSMHAWFASLRSEKVVICLRSFFVHGRCGNSEIHMHTKFHLHALYSVQV